VRIDPASAGFLLVEPFDSFGDGIARGPSVAIDG